MIMQLVYTACIKPAHDSIMTRQVCKSHATRLLKARNVCMGKVM